MRTFQNRAGQHRAVAGRADPAGQDADGRVAVVADQELAAGDTEAQHRGARRLRHAVDGQIEAQERFQVLPKARGPPGIGAIREAAPRSRAADTPAEELEPAPRRAPEAGRTGPSAPTPLTPLVERLTTQSFATTRDDAPLYHRRLGRGRAVSPCRAGAAPPESPAPSPSLSRPPRSARAAATPAARPGSARPAATSEHTGRGWWGTPPAPAASEWRFRNGCCQR